MSGDAWGCLTLIVCVLATAGYLALERWLEHREIMAGKRKADEGEE